ncbi:hypothetical protein GW17_00042688 [Ensete ventricosum]|nr:hypothetical protein GW17_00042688 [Ensete ventricosum]
MAVPRLAAPWTRHAPGNPVRVSLFSFRNGRPSSEGLDAIPHSTRAHHCVLSELCLSLCPKEAAPWTTDAVARLPTMDVPITIGAPLLDDSCASAPREHHVMACRRRSPSCPTGCPARGTDAVWRRALGEGG